MPPNHAYLPVYQCMLLVDYKNGKGESIAVRVRIILLASKKVLTMLSLYFQNKVRIEMSRIPRYAVIDGKRQPPPSCPSLMRNAMNFEPEKDDIFVVAYPKCGTTLVTQIVALILRNGETFTTPSEYFSFIPFLEFTTTAEISKIPKPRCFKTHLPLNLLNLSGEARYIYVARNPADCLVSHYHHARFFPIYFFSDGTLDQMFELFIKGEVESDDYFDHLLSGYERRNEPNTLFLTYESILADRRGACLQIARFLGEDHYKNLLKNDEAVLKRVMEYSSMEHMKSTVDGFFKKQFSSIPPEELQMANPVLKNLAELVRETLRKGERSIGSFVRKGKVGEGKVSLSEDQLKKLSDRIKEKTAHSDVMSLWNEIYFVQRI
ncbi:sulfotransferase 1C2 [Caerostris darwini]|uniref:Sulfotransferase 1C2 n=1 Tax=Caerostris darwini TaxID=1538125 RepID=A0AAV4Q3V2_9ARAC|nr:sulfotransferase 1C2 [Caerostris darwini]